MLITDLRMVEERGGYAGGYLSRWLQGIPFSLKVREGRGTGEAFPGLEKTQ